MKYLLLVRHAKSSWKFPELDDHDRPLNGRGERDRWRMAEYLSENEEQLDHVFSSSAVRALTLAETLGEVLNLSVTSQQALYAFGSGSLSSAIRQLPNQFDRIAVVGHNPAITELVNHLTRAGIANVPTSGIAAIKCDMENWSDLAPSHCELQYFVAPKML